MTRMNIDALPVIRRSDFKIERGALGVAYFIRGPHQYAWMLPTVALDFDRAEAVIASLLRAAQTQESQPDVMYFA